MKKILVIFILIFLVFSCDRPTLFLNPFDSNSDIDANNWRPDSLRATVASDSKVRLDWRQNIQLIDGFTILRSENSSVYELIAHVDSFTRSYIDTGLSITSNYCYAIAATAGDNMSSFDSIEANATFFSEILNFRVDNVNEDGVLLAWDHDYTEEEKYSIYRNKDLDRLEEIGETGKDTLTYFDDDIFSGSQHYALKVSSKYNESDYLSNIPFMSGPQDLTITALNDQTIQLTWSSQENYLTGFSLQRSENNLAYTIIDTIYSPLMKQKSSHAINSKKKTINSANKKSLQEGSKESISLAYSYVDTALVFGNDYRYKLNSFAGTYVSDDTTTNDQTTVFETPVITSITQIDNQSALIEWSHNCNFELGYIIKRISNNGTEEFLDTLNLNTFQYTDTDLELNKYYHYQVSAFTNRNTSNYSESLETILEFPEPSIQILDMNSNYHVNIEWQNDYGFNVGFEIQRAIGGSIFEIMDTCLTDPFVYLDTIPEVGYENSYRLRAFDELGNLSPFSDIESYDFEMPVPFNLNAELINDTIAVTWDYNFYNVDSFRIERRVNSSQTGYVWRIQANNPFQPDNINYSIIDTNIALGNLYTYQISAFKAPSIHSEVIETRIEATDTTNQMIFVEGGTFQMGSNYGSANEQPVHSVTVDNFEIGKYEITHSEYLNFLNAMSVSSDGSFSGVEVIDIDDPDCAISFDGGFYFSGSIYTDDRWSPVYEIPWYGAIHYCNWLSDKEGLEAVYTINVTSVTADFSKNGYRLPTEAEWEYAARGGQESQDYIYSGSNTIDEVAWYKVNSLDVGTEHDDYGVHHVGEKQENELDLYDMSGNVWEWCWDWYNSTYNSTSQLNPKGPTSGQYRVMRGGVWYRPEDECRVAYRGYTYPDNHYDHVVCFRLARGAQTPNTSPEITELRVNSTTMGIEDTLHIQCIASDFDGDELTYTWQASSGSITGNGEDVFFTAPSQEGTCKINCEVNDGHGGSDTTSINITVIGSQVTLEMISVIGGTFQMGSDDGEADEQPIHTVILGNYEIGKYEVTHAEIIAFMNDAGVTSFGTYAGVEVIDMSDPNCAITYDGSFDFSATYRVDDEECPIIGLTWYGAIHFCNWMSENEGLELVYTINGTSVSFDFGKNGYRLPTEAEWEYAAKGGQNSQGFTYSGSSSINDIAWHAGNSQNKTHPVGNKLSNELGLYDMSGNAWEWCWDWYGSYSNENQSNPMGPTSGTSRVLRGGGWHNTAPGCFRVTDRGYVYSGNYYDIGLRLAKGAINTQPIPEMISVQGGTFQMGSSSGETRETPIHTVTIGNFEIGKYEVTQSLYEEVMGSNPSHFSGDNNPVEKVSWNNAIEFCNTLSESLGLEKVYTISGIDVSADFTKNGYRLPTEAEWEFAARGGNNSQGYTYSGSNTISDVAWYQNNSGNVSYSVGEKQANELGLYDMTGNIWEWCWDWNSSYTSSSQTNPTGPSTGTTKVYRGGGWLNDAIACRIPIRRDRIPSYTGYEAGFRLARGAITNTSPTIHSIDINHTAIVTEDTLHIKCNASDIDGDELSYIWNINSGTISGSGANIVFTAPNQADTILIQCEVDDGRGGTDTSSVQISVVELNDMIRVEGGTFQMGSNNGNADELPIHTVTVSDFELGKHEVTHVKFIEFLNDVSVSSNGSYEGVEVIDVDGMYCAVTYDGSFSFLSNLYADDARCPVIDVTWHGMIHYCNWLSEKYGFENVYTINGTSVMVDFSQNGFRLPTEAEWEFAARGGNDSQGYTFSGSNNCDDVAWFRDNSYSLGSSHSDWGTHPVGEKQANELGFYDMSGNVLEWCWDWYAAYGDSNQYNPIGPLTSDRRVLRSGNWVDDSDGSRVSWRGTGDPDIHNDDRIGFRIARGAHLGSVPEISSISVSDSTICVDDTLHINCVASDADGDELTFLWNAGSGAISGSGANVVFTAPSQEGVCTINCEVNDESGLSDSLSIDIRVIELGAMVQVDGSTFQMGSNNGESDELPIHTVSLSDFEIGKYEVTHKEYIEFLNDYGVSSDGSYSGIKLIDMDDERCVVAHNGSFYFSANGYAEDEKCPIIEITWSGAVHYCNWMSENEGLESVYTISGSISADFTKNGYRLPTEAEWEFAARGGNSSQEYTFSGSNTLNDVAWNVQNSDIIKPVGELLANELDVYDMNGNAIEWCWDWYNSSYYSNSPELDPTGPSTGSDRVLRGGAWSSIDVNTCRIAKRSYGSPGLSNASRGFRLAKGVHISNSNPEVSPLEVSDTIICVGDTLHVKCIATDPDDDPLSFRWEASLGSISGTGSDVIYTAPTMGGICSLSVEVGDGQGGMGGSSINIRVIDPNAMISVEGGLFQMGSSTGESNEQPVHSVSLSNFEIGKYEVTHREFIEFLNDAGVSSDGSYSGAEVIDMDGEYCAISHNGNFYFSGNSYADNENCPVFEITWYGAVQYCNWMSIEEGLESVYTISGGTNVSADFSKNGYRLPTEAEWEFAARGGNDNLGYVYSGSNTCDDVAWYLHNSINRTHITGIKQANELNLNDMSGNVWEWCWDRYGSTYYNSSPDTDPTGPTTGIYRLCRGGSWSNDASLCHTTYRRENSPSGSYGNVGFRIAKGAHNLLNVPEMISVTGGTFQMGSSSGGDTDERPVRNVALSDYDIGKFEVTLAEYIEFLNDANVSSDGAYLGVEVIAMEDPDCAIEHNGNFFFSANSIADDINCPVIAVSWYGVAHYCNWLSSKMYLEEVYSMNGTDVTADFSKNGYRLPTEAEWEYAARGGQSTNGYTYSGSSSVGSVAWYEINSESKTHSVGEKSANELGLFDMSGNVYEWCWDWRDFYSSDDQSNPIGPTSGSDRVLRGGAWYGSSYRCRVADRIRYVPSFYSNAIGFRIAKGVPENTEPVIVELLPDTTEINMGSSICISCISNDQDNDKLVYSWECSTGEISSDSVIAVYTAPFSTDSCVISCTIDDGKGGNAIETVQINIINNMVLIVGGTFTMGDVWGGGDSDEIPTHSVTLSDYYIGKYEVTHETYIEFLNDCGVSFNGSYNGNEVIDMDDSDCAINHNGSAFYFSGSSYADDIQCPIIEVTWHGAVEYCNWLSEQAGRQKVYSISGTSVTADFSKNGYRLPTEAEWEYAARSGGRNDRKWSGTNTESELGNYAWYNSNSGSMIHEVGSKQANDLCIYDMSGNVWEWCWDWYGSYSSSSQSDPTGPSSGSGRVLRGGSWLDSNSMSRVANRTIPPLSSHVSFGFRIALSSGS